VPLAAVGPERALLFPSREVDLVSSLCKAACLVTTNWRRPRQHRLLPLPVGLPPEVVPDAWGFLQGAGCFLVMTPKRSGRGRQQKSRPRSWPWLTEWVEVGDPSLSRGVCFRIPGDDIQECVDG